MSRAAVARCLRPGLALAVAAALAPSCGGQSARVSESRSGAAGASGGALEQPAGGGCNDCAGAGGTDEAGAVGAAGTNASGGRGGRAAAGGAPGAGRAGGGRGGAASAGAAARASGGGAGIAGEAGAEGGDGSVAPRGVLAVSKVAVYQAVEITLSDHGDNPKPNAPIIAGRTALLRVWLEPDAAFAPRDVTAKLVIDGGTSTRSVTLAHAVSGPSVDADLTTTLDFTLRASEVSDAVTLSLEIDDSASGAAELSRWPASGAYTLHVSSSNGPFSLVLVPVVVGGFVPDVGAGTVARFQRYLSRIYPASSVEASAREPLTLGYDVLADGTGWDDALDAVYAVRDADAPPANVYYYGVLTPGATFRDYCGGDCVVGLSTVAARDEEGYRAAIGTGYFESSVDTASQETLAHELGHALGRDHAPCGGPDGVDRRYPYPGAAIGVRGYEGKTLLDPDDYKDVMSYCVPVWISDYTYSAIFSRISYVNGLALRPIAWAPTERRRYRTLIVTSAGPAHWGSERTPASPPDGEPAELELLDAAGAVLDTIVVAYARLDHLDGGFLSVPSDALGRAGVAAVRVGGEVVEVP